VVLCRRLKLFTDGIVAIDGSKFKAVNNRDKNFTDRKLQARLQQLEESITPTSVARRCTGTGHQRARAARSRRDARRATTDG
jgi:hypothetical protein